ncbi:MAG: Cj0069 family protein [Burkholderiales bacterium]|nr:Cj0069 family protein [Burkholderiales bacterium]
MSSAPPSAPISSPTRAAAPPAGPIRLALLYPGDRAARDRADPAESRFAALFAALAEAGVHAEPAVYHDDFADEVAAQLRQVHGVLIWCNPIEGGRRRDRLDALLRDAAATGVFVSTHPDTIVKLGTKDVLLDTRDLPFGSDVHRLDSLEQLAADLPARLQRGPRVLKQYRGHSGIGVWRVQVVQRADAAVDTQGNAAPLGATPPARGPARALLLRHAQRGSEEERVDMPTLLQRLAGYFEPEQGGHMIDQAWQPRLAEGMVRAYLVQGRVAGFGHQAVNALFPARAGEPAPQPGPRLYHGPDEPRFQELRERLESESGWIELLRQRVGVEHERLPMLWDCDFMFGERGAEGPERYVLCEVNVSSVSPFPPSAIAPLVAAVKQRLGRR